MGDELSFGMTDHQFGDFFIGKNLMDHAGAIPKQEVAAGLFLKVGSQVSIRSKDDGLVLGYAFDNLHGIGGGTADIREGFYFGGTVDVTDHDMVGVFLFKLAK